MLWEKLDRIVTTGYTVDDYLALTVAVEAHLAMVFHRLLQGSRARVKLLINSHMVGLMPQSAADRFARAGLLALLPLSGQGAFGAVGYTVRADRQPSAAAQRFLQALRDASQGFASPV